MRNKIYTLLITFYLCGFIPQSQGNPIDSMLAVLKNDIRPSESILTHNRLKHHIYKPDTAAFHFHKDAIDMIAHLENDTLGQFLNNSLKIIYFSRVEKFKNVIYDAFN